MKIYDEHKNHHDLHNQIIHSAHVAAIAMFILCAEEQTTLICQELLMCTNKDTNINTQQCTAQWTFIESHAFIVMEIPMIHLMGPIKNFTLKRKNT